MNQKSHKYNLAHHADVYNKLADHSMVNRNRMFYCTHINRNNTFFRDNGLKVENGKPQVTVEKILKSAFGFMRVRRSLKETL